MKKNSIITAILSTAALLSGCSDFNEQFFADGTVGSLTPLDVKAIEYTLTDADYKTIATDTTNMRMALEASKADSTALAALTNNKYFSGNITAIQYAPAFLFRTWFMADDDSAIQLTYRQKATPSARMELIAAAKAYTVTENDYKTAWGSDTQFANYFTTETSPAAKIPALLTALYAEPDPGDHIMVTYSYAATEPIFAATTIDTSSPVTMRDIYVFTNKKWTTASDIVILQPADYTAMGKTGSDPDLSGDVDTYIVPFLKSKFIYAAADDAVIMVYKYYEDTASALTATEYVYNGTTWVNKSIVSKTDQFVRKNGVWKYDPTITIDYSVMGTTEFKAFCQYCCNWVYDNIDVPLGATPRDNAGEIISANKITVGGAAPVGQFYVSNYGNNEWYAGTYAYYGEMNWNAYKAANAFKAANLSLSNDEIIATMQANAATVFQNVLHYMYPEANPNDAGKYLIKVYDYVSRKVYSYTFAVTGIGTFEYIEGSFGVAK